MSAHLEIPNSTKDLDVPINKEQNKVILEPTLINEGDFIEIQTLVSNFSDKNKIKVEGRISGIKEISKYKESRFPFWVLLVGMIIFFIFASAGTIDQTSGYSKFYFPIAFFSYLLSFIIVLAIKKNRMIFFKMFKSIVEDM